MKKLNLTGRLVNKLRNERDWTQDELADRLQKAGWMISRSGVSKIESGFVMSTIFNSIISPTYFVSRRSLSSQPWT